MTDSQTLPTDRQTHSEIDLAKTNTKTTRPFEDDGIAVNFWIVEVHTPI